MGHIYHREQRCIDVGSILYGDVARPLLRRGRVIETKPSSIVHIQITNAVTLLDPIKWKL